jgi:hypothetical protein
MNVIYSAVLGVDARWPAVRTKLGQELIETVVGWDP